eukprot:6251777-Lingulodinium_polyedra.AAC.1
MQPNTARSRARPCLRAPAGHRHSSRAAGPNSSERKRQRPTLAKLPFGGAKTRRTGPHALEYAEAGCSC